MPDCTCGGTNPNCIRCWVKWCCDDKSTLTTVPLPITKQKDLIQCPKCNSKVRVDRLEKHIRKVHHPFIINNKKLSENINISSEVIKDCPCGGANENCFRCWGKGWYRPTLSSKHLQVTKKRRFDTMQKKNGNEKVDHLQNNVKKVHSPVSNNKTKSYVSNFKNESINTFGKSNKNTNRTSSNIISTETSDPRFSQQHESRFGDKNIGYVARDNGKFGSISLYDDYSEDSDAD